MNSANKALLSVVAKVVADAKSGFKGEAAQIAAELRALVAEARAHIERLKNEANQVTGAKGADGTGIVDAVIDRSGHLTLTLSNGTIKDVGQVVGRDGANGVDGSSGADGIGFDDLDVIYDGERNLTIRFTKGDQTKCFPFRLPILLDRGVYLPTGSYQQGDVVTYAGSMWVAKQDSPVGKPGEAAGWRLAVKRGRDGKPGPAGQQGPQGAPGDYVAVPVQPTTQRAKL